ncbi:hypothetical protein [Streptomyces sp. NPDC058672]|uniref:hypothetical protein n=1 Tax=Streptomyces sp. NPDC058672 TaxID=3346591 RepID=UPI003648E774
MDRLDSHGQEGGGNYVLALELNNELIALYSSFTFYAKSEEEKERFRIQLLKYGKERQELDFMDNTEMQRVLAEYSEKLKQERRQAE